MNLKRVLDSRHPGNCWNASARPHISEHYVGDGVVPCTEAVIRQNLKRIAETRMLAVLVAVAPEHRRTAQRANARMATAGHWQCSHYVGGDELTELRVSRRESPSTPRPDGRPARHPG